MKTIYHIPFLLYFLLSQCLCAQTKYNQLANKPIGHNIKQISIWRYALKNAPLPPPKEPEYSIDTVFKKDHSILRIDTSILDYVTNDGPIQYPDTTLLEKNTYNSKGLLVLKEEPYQTKTTFSYDKKNRHTGHLVYKEDSVLFTKITTTYYDLKKKIRISTKNVEGERSWLLIQKADRKNRLIERQEFADNDTVPYHGHKCTYQNHGRLKTFYSFTYGAPDDYWQTYYNKQGQKVKQVYIYQHPQKSTNGDTVKSQTTNFYYDKAGNLTREEKFDNNPDSIFEETNYMYNQYNKPILKHEINKRSHVNTRTQTYYLPQGIIDYYDVFSADESIIRYKYNYVFYNSASTK